MESFAVRLKYAMNLRGYRAFELAEEMKCSKSLISQYLAGSCKAKQDTIFVISEILKVSPSWLMGLDVPMNIQDNGIYEKILKKLYKLDKDQLDALSNMIDVMYPSPKNKVELGENEIWEE